jgi:RimJ/RimL family protein N-acetyltransferase
VEHEAHKPLSWWASVWKRTRSSVVGEQFATRRRGGVPSAGRHQTFSIRACVAGDVCRARGARAGLAAALVQQVVGRARTRVEEVCLTVVTSNAVARRLYSTAGFKEYELERRALKVGCKYYDEVLMALPLTPSL